jgi:phospholipid transport system substrate-binding protein
MPLPVFRLLRSIPLALALLGCLVIAGTPRPATADISSTRDPAAFINQLGDEALKSLTGGNLSKEERRHRFATLLDESFDVPGIAKFTLGRYWQTATDAQRQEYLKLFHDMIVSTYADRFSQYSGEHFKVGNVSSDRADYSTVQTQVLRTDGSSVRVDWRLHKGSDGSLRVIDVVIEGVSMTITQRSEFASVIQNKGGLNGLIDVLRQRTN